MKSWFAFHRGLGLQLLWGTGRGVIKGELVYMTGYLVGHLFLSII